MPDNIRSLHLAQESTFGVDPSANGSAYLPIGLTSRPYMANETELAETNYATGRNADTEMLVLRDGSSVPVEIDLTGPATSGADNIAPVALDAIDFILAAAFGTAARVINGRAVGVGSTTANIVLASAVLAADDLACLYVLASNRMRYRPVAGAGPTYTVAPNWEAAPVQTNDYVVASRQYAHQAAQGPSLAAVLNIDGTLQLGLGMKPQGKLSIKGRSGKKITLSTALRGDTFTPAVTKASLPAVSTFPSAQIFTLSDFYFNGVNYGTKSFSLDFELSTVDVEASTAATGRADIQVVKVEPTITIEPLFATSTWQGFMDGQTIAPVILQMGAGRLASGRNNSMGFHAPRAQVVECKDQNDNGIVRHMVKLKILDGVTARRWTLARC